ncbi:MAG: hypothetical protein ACO3DQ_10020 [Cephaloticoccus sp.]
MIRLLSLFALVAGAVLAEPVDEHVRAGLAAEAAFDSAAALRHFQAAAKLRPDDAFIEQKLARQYSDLTTSATEVSQKRALAELALKHSLRARELDPTNAIAALSVAISYGKLGLYSSVRDKIAYARLTHDYALEATKLDPECAWAWSVLGRWHYEVATLGRTKRVVVALFYGGLPTASTAEAVTCLQRAVALEPANPVHAIELGFALLADHRPEEARAQFEHGLALPGATPHDDLAKRRAREALASLPA